MRKCVITVPADMTDATYGYLCAKAKAKFGTDLSFRRIADDALLGGFILELDGTVYDLSLRTQLETMKRKMVFEEAQE